MDEDYYKAIIVNCAFNSNYIQYERIAGEGKYKNLSVKKYLNRIKPYLSDIRNNHKIQGGWRIHSGNKIIGNKTQSEWKLQLSTEIKFVSSLPDPLYSYYAFKK